MYYVLCIMCYVWCVMCYVVGTVPGRYVRYFPQHNRTISRISPFHISHISHIKPPALRDNRTLGNKTLTLTLTSTLGNKICLLRNIIVIHQTSPTNYLVTSAPSPTHHFQPQHPTPAPNPSSIYQPNPPPLQSSNPFQAKKSPTKKWATSAAADRMLPQPPTLSIDQAEPSALRPRNLPIRASGCQGSRAEGERLWVESVKEKAKGGEEEGEEGMHGARRRGRRR